MIRTSVVTRAVLAFAVGAVASSDGATPPDPAAAERGRSVFNRYCISCHGVDGDGRGPTADWIDPRPRILTSGTFKFRSAPTAEMERRDVIQFVKTLSPRFKEEAQVPPIAIPPPPPFTPDLVQKGQGVWKRLQCAVCHGETGKGDGPSALTLRDDWGYPIVPRDFTRGPLKVGDTAEDLYRTFMTGLNGSPMPSYDGTVSADDAWALVFYVRSLRKE